MIVSRTTLSIRPGVGSHTCEEPIDLQTSGITSTKSSGSRSSVFMCISSAVSSLRSDVVVAGDHKIPRCWIYQLGSLIQNEWQSQSTLWAVEWGRVTCALSRSGRASKKKSSQLSFWEAIIGSNVVTLFNVSSGASASPAGIKHTSSCGQTHKHMGSADCRWGSITPVLQQMDGKIRVVGEKRHWHSAVPRTKEKERENHPGCPKRRTECLGV